MKSGDGEARGRAAPRRGSEADPGGEVSGRRRGPARRSPPPSEAAQGLGPAPGRRARAAHPRARRAARGRGSAEARRRRAAQAHARDRERVAVAHLRREARPRLRLRARGRGALPRELLRAGARRRRGAAHDPGEDRPARGAEAPQGDRRAGAPAQGAGRRHRADRLGQVDHARRDHRQDQPHLLEAHPHARGPDRVRAREQEERALAPRGRLAHQGFGPGLRAAIRAGRRRRAGRRDARLRDDLARADRGRDGHARVRHPAHEQRAQDDRPHHRHLPVRRAGADPPLARRVAGRRGRAAPPAHRRRQGPRAPRTRSC